MRLVYVVLGWLAGILLAAAMPQLPAIFWLLAVTAAVFILVIGWRSPQRVFLLSLCALTLGSYRMELVPRAGTVAYLNSTPQTVQIEGLIVSEPRVRTDRVDLRVDVASAFNGQDVLDVNGLVLVSVRGQSSLSYGDHIRASGYLGLPATFDTFSYADYLARSGVFSVMQNARVEVLSHDEGSPLYAALLSSKTRAHHLIEQALPDPSSALLSGILLGDESGIDPQLADDFSAVGASHIIAISGFNMVIVSGVVMGLLGRITTQRWLAVFIGLLALGLYTLFVGASAAVVRAALMSSLLVIAPLLRRKTYVPASLAFVVLLLTIVNPLSLWDVGFQLSAAAVLGLALFAEPLQRYMDAFMVWLLPNRVEATAAKLIREPLVVTLAVQLTTLPLTILYFQKLSLVVLVVNLLIVPVQAALLIVGGVALLVAFASPMIALPLFWLDGLLLGWTIGVVRWFAAWPGANITFYIDPRLIALYFLLVVGGALLMSAKPLWVLRLTSFVRQRLVLNVVMWGGLGVVLLSGAILLSRPDGLLHIWFLDVGHSNAILVQTPGGAQMLIDGGAYPSRLLTALGDRMPFYDREIEVIVVTQPDENDIAALPAVLNRYQAGVILTNGHPIVTQVQQDMIDLAADAPVVPVTAGYEIAFDDTVRVEVLHPSQAPQTDEAFNTDSVVLRLYYGDVSFLLMGDLSAEGQASLLENGLWPAANILQVPNHAREDAINEDFLQAVQPQVALVHIDEANRWGDPGGRSLTLLADMPLYRSDVMGPLHFWSDGTTAWVSPDF
ncbi:ComEC/Rec2 family competence protein [Phototrophicus methaneseepsis]|uniref:ComEC/Rec2 family competence protein n=1 Tax=Phototrophicus methaneseepsis TaxID=2710758 RepID=A0A7S8E566_9CHLR|nr:ComEC/Rec2 family competence protein [Phototrophicus methaneseepsis]QPC80555.1 ComEC/Rec2 family competence protein [Phototrophicus methaneseepsis]